MVGFFPLALLLLVDVAPQPISKTSSFCECLTVESAVDGLAQLRRVNWRGIDQAEEVKKLWPRVPLLPCEPGAQPGITAAADYVARCCETCELCGGVAFDERRTGSSPSPGPSFQGIEVWLIRPTSDSTKSILRALTTAALGESSKPTSTSHSESRVIDGYNWVSNGAPFHMRVDAIESGGGWLGHFQVGRCSSPGPTETWPVGGDKVIPVSKAEAEERAGEGTVLSFSYTTQCLLEDRACWNAELDQMWPRLQSLAAGRTVAVVEIDVEECIGRNVLFQVTRSKDGHWKGGLWRPKKP